MQRHAIALVVTLLLMTACAAQNATLPVTHDVTKSGASTSSQDSNCTPEQKFCDGNAFTFVKQAWLFANAPSDISGVGIDAAGVHTPCTSCSISRVTTVAQKSANTYSENGGVFGADSLGHVYIHYMQTAYGEWESNCVPGTSLCTFVFSMTPSKYYGGYQYYPNTIDAASTVNGAAPANSPWESYDGISLLCCSATSRTQDLSLGAHSLLHRQLPFGTSGYLSIRE